jgi:hypothetical protein
VANSVWISDPLQGLPQQAEITFPERRLCGCVELVFDTNLDHINIYDYQKECVKDYRLEGRRGNEWILLADEKEDRIYAKSFVLENIKLAYKSGNYKMCRQYCLDFDESDDEIALIKVSASFKIAVDEFENGNLRRSVAYFDEVLSCASETEYYTGNLQAAAGMYLRFMRRFSPNLSSSVIDEDEVEHYCAMNDNFCRYIYALDCIEESHTTFASELISNGDREDAEVLHLGARIDMIHSNYHSASKKLNQILTNNRPVSHPLLFIVFADLEECSKALNDFRAAYEYSTAKMDLLQKMLSDDE